MWQLVDKVSGDCGRVLKRGLPISVAFVLLIVLGACGGNSALTQVPTDVPTAVPTQAPTAEPTVPATQPPTPEPTGATDLALQRRIDLLAEQLEAMRQEFHIPGMAIAVVKDDQVIMARGFGLADLENNVPVSSDTIFAIGSATKAFTTVLAGMLVDEGRMDWDDPVTDYLPSFTLDVDSQDQNAQVTIRDLLSHRTGFVRMGILAANDSVSSDEILQAAVGAEPWAPFRERYYYNNVMYLAAGVAMGSAAQSDWDTLVENRIFEPLGMKSTSTTLKEAQEDPRLAMGYRWEEALESHDSVEMHSVENFAPAAAINSNVLDMAQWLRLQLGRGNYEGQQLISEQQHRETWTSQIEIAPGVDYGLGWTLREWDGEPLVENGGRVPGFTTRVAMLPESNLGIVLLTNLNETPFPGEAVNIVWEALAREPVDDGTSVANADYGPYLGKYTANFGDFEDEEFNVLVQKNRLAVDVPGQTIYELKAPDEEGKWLVASIDGIAVSFDLDDDGDVVGMSIHQGGLIFELPREGQEIAPEIPLAELEKYLGTYRSDEMGDTVEVLIQHNRLAVDWPGQMVYELRPPNAESSWVFRVTDAWSLRFDEEDSGSIESFTFIQDGLENQFGRTVAEPLPTLEEILALRQTESRKTALREMGAYRVTGTVEIPQSGVTGTLTAYIGGEDRYRVDVDFGKFGSVRTAVSGDRAWAESGREPLRELYGQLLDQVKLSHPATYNADWLDYFDSARVLRSGELDDQKVYVLELRRGDLPPTTIYVDSLTGDILQAEGVALFDGIQIVTRFEDYREFQGLRIPYRAISSNEFSGSEITRIENIDVNLDVEDSFFILDQVLGD